MKKKNTLVHKNNNKKLSLDGAKGKLYEKTCTPIHTCFTFIEGF